MTLLLKILLFNRGTGVFFALGASAKSYSSHSTSLYRPGKPQSCYQARAGQCQYCWHLYLVGPDRETDPFEGHFCVFQSALVATSSEDCPQVIRNKVSPKMWQWGTTISGPPATFRSPSMSSVAFTWHFCHRFSPSGSSSFA